MNCYNCGSYPVINDKCLHCGYVSDQRMINTGDKEANARLIVLSWG
jgi:ribosomal protein L37E